jgi:hypothetical protein
VPEDPSEVLNRIAATTACEPEQVREVVRLALETLHKIAFCNEKSVTAALTECRWMFDEGACYHLGGILEEARRNCDPGTSWSEFFLRFSPGSWHQFRPVLEHWANERSEARKALDEEPENKL